MGYDQFPSSVHRLEVLKPLSDDQSCHFSASPPGPLARLTAALFAFIKLHRKKPSLTLQGLEFGLIYQHQGLFVRMSYGLSLLVCSFVVITKSSAVTGKLPPNCHKAPFFVSERLSGGGSLHSKHPPPPFITVNLPIPPDPLAAQRGQTKKRPGPKHGGF